MQVEMELARILIRETDDTHIVELREIGPAPEDARIFPIVIGLHEAAAIERRLMGHEPLRPQTHELLDNVITELGYDLASLVITDLQDHTFFAQLNLRRGEESHAIDARPSDALALAVGRNTPIYVEDAVLAEVCRPIDD
ncbi:MAG: bifunctional nuclease family protein [Planctomycetota bacterium]